MFLFCSYVKLPLPRVMGIHRRREAIGRALLAHAEAIPRAEGRRFVTVKTRGPSKPYEPYERTRRFYEALGYVALEEFPTFLDPENPALFLVKPT
jgi:hypothetical protein